jgi:two-component system, OmpR family, KDP operon response regulator KdpE
MSEPGQGRVVLVVEDEPQVARFLRASLGSHGFRLIEAASGAQALALAATCVPDFVLLDLGLPDMDGVEVARRLREWSGVPIIVLSARGQERDKIEALDAGADDYLTKPFGIGELLARIRVALRHADRTGSEGGAAEFATGALRIDLPGRHVFFRGAEVHLTPIEYRLLAVLVKHAGHVVTQRQLLKEVWGPGAVSQTHYLRVYMANLRAKLEDEPARPRVFLTEPGVGYRLRDGEDGGLTP